MSEYTKQADQFLKDTETEFKAEFVKHGVHFEGEKDTRDIYKITLKRGSRVYEFDFGQCTAHSGKYKVFGLGNNKIMFMKDKDFVEAFRKGQRLFNKLQITKLSYGNGLLKDRDYVENKDFAEPTAYDVLACLNPFDEDFEEFCASFGYEEDSRTAYKIFGKVEEETKQLKILWTDSELEKLQEIN